MKTVFIVPFHVKGGATPSMPSDVSGAYVSCYVEADTYVTAIRKCISALQGDGFQVADILQPIHSMAVSDWSAHVNEQWPDHGEHMPDQATFETAMADGKVIYGPFGGYQAGSQAGPA